jgi:hypothetical protein
MIFAYQQVVWFLLENLNHVEEAFSLTLLDRNTPKRDETGIRIILEVTCLLGNDSKS